MTVSVQASKTLTGGAAGDTLTGGSSGYDFGEAQTGVTASPEKAVFLSHDGLAKITSFALHVAGYSGTYGGDYSANADLNRLIGHGDLDYGLDVDFRWDGSPLFDTGQYTTFKTNVGDNFSNRITMPVSAMSRNNAGTEVDASAPVAGELGQATNAALGDRAHMTFRYRIPAGETATGKWQWDLYYSYNYTS